MPSAYLGNIARAVTSTFEGMAVTMSWMFRRPMTVQYPDKMERPLRETLPEGWRGVLETDLALCTGCGLCDKKCPIDCIVVDVEKDPESKQRMIKRFDINVVKCMVCGICSEVCPTDAIRHTHEFELTAGDISKLVHRYVPGDPVPVYKPKKGVPKPETRPLGEILREIRDSQRPGGDE